MSHEYTLHLYRLSRRIFGAECNETHKAAAGARARAMHFKIVAVVNAGYATLGALTVRIRTVGRRQEGDVLVRMLPTSYDTGDANGLMRVLSYPDYWRRDRY